MLDAIMDLVFLIGVVYTISKTIRGLMGGGVHKGFSGASQSQRARAANTVQGRTVRDPECGMFVSTEVSHRLTQGKEVLHFCSKACLQEYEKKMAKV